MTKSILIVFLMFVLFLNAEAQSIEFKHLSIDDGLSQNTVNSIVQDKKGVIWIATLGGLNKFNGYDFVSYTHNERDSGSISHNRVNVVYIDKKGLIWVGTDDGLNLYSPSTESFKVIKSLSDKKYFVYAIKEDSEGRLWVGTQQGLKLLNSQNQLVDVPITAGNVRKRVQCIYVDHYGHLWLGLAQGVRVLDPSHKTVLKTPDSLEKLILGSWVQSIKQSANGDFWLATEKDGLIHYRDEKSPIAVFTEKTGLLSSTVRDLNFVDVDKLWIATKMGLNILDVKSDQISSYRYSPDLNPANSLSQPSVKCIFKDFSSNVWMGTYSGGINLVYNFKKIFSHKGIQQGDPHPLSNKEINAILGDSKNNLWIATDGGGLNYWDRKSGNVNIYKYNSPNILYQFVKDIAYDDQKKKLWLGTAAGILIFDISTHQFSEFKSIQEKIKVEFNHAYCFLNSPDGLWVGTNYGGVFLVKDDRIIRSYNFKNHKLVSDNISCLTLDGNNNLWIGYLLSGLSRMNLKTGEIKNYSFKKDDLRSLSNNAVSSLFMDEKKHLWVGTNGGGLNYFDFKNDCFYVLNKTNGLNNNTIHAIEEDKNGALWVSSDKGICKISFKADRFPLIEKNLEVTNYSVIDGLQSNQFVQGASYKDTSGELFFGGINGLNSFFPDNIGFNRLIPNVILTDFNILNQRHVSAEDSPLTKPIDDLKEITLRYDETYFTIKYAALNYIYPERNSYAYKLEGFNNDDWHAVGNQRSVTYTGLDPGSYVFKVKGSNNSGIWNDKPRTLRIFVLPPWWKSGYAKLIYGLILIGLLYIFNYYSKYTERLKNKLKHESDLYHREQELSQKKLDFFINISHEIKTPITMIMAPLQQLLNINEGNTKTLNYLTLMHRNGERLLTLIDQLLDLRKLDGEQSALKAIEGNVTSFVKEIVVVFSNLAKTKDIQIEFMAVEEELFLWFDRDKLEKVMYNLISNAVKYTTNYGNIQVAVRKGMMDEASCVIISITDNGCGIAEDRIPNIFSPFNHYDSIQNNVLGTGIGLAFAKQLIDLHHGNISVVSRPAEHGKNGYTCFEVKIPSGNSYLSPAEIDHNYLNSEDIVNYKRFSLNQRSNFLERKANIKSTHENQKFNMLLVEDNLDVMDFLAGSFEADFNIIKSINGRIGYDEAIKVMPDIIISDVMMPVMNGIEMCVKLKSDILTSHIPVILLTARSPLLFKLEGLETGADEYITKPFNLDLLDVKIWNLLENRQKMKVRYQKQITLQPTNTNISTFDDKFIEKVMKYVETNIADEHLNVEDLSEHVGMSRGNLYKKLKALTSKSPVEFIRDIRLKRAAQLLKQHKMYINEVAFMVGFQDVTYFRKCFKDEFGYTPTEFAKKEHEG